MLTEERPDLHEHPEGSPDSDLDEPTADPQGREPNSGTRRLDIQGLRAVAVILVVAFHSGLPVKGGFIGVDVFLVISGFVITGMLMRELEATRKVRFRTFYARRIKRLLPALAVLTTFVIGVSVFLGSSFGSQQTTAKTGLGATWFVANIVIYRDSLAYFAPEAAANPLLHTWTLSVEEQVYMVFPALLAAIWRFGPRSRRATGRRTVSALALLGSLSFLISALMSFGLMPLLWRAGDETRLAFYSSFTRFWEFAVGAGIALAAKRLARIPREASLGLGLLGAVAIALGAFTLDGFTPYPGLAVLLPVLGAAAVITAGFQPDLGVPRLLSKRPMVGIGDLSYAWYLWHWPLIVFASMLWPGASWLLVAVGVLSIVPARLSTLKLEDPIRHDRRIRGWKVVALAMVCLAVPTLACLGLAAGASASWGNEEVASMQSQVGEVYVAEANGCDDAATEGTSIGEPDCVFNASAGGPSIYLVGNSVAGQYGEALIGAATEIGSPFFIDTSKGCAFTGVTTFEKGRTPDDPECNDYFTDTIDRLSAQEPGIVVMAATWDLGIGDPARIMEGESAEETAVTQEEKSREVVRSLTGGIRQLREAGHHVILVLPTPRFFHTSDSEIYTASPVTASTINAGHATAWRAEDCPVVVAQSEPADCGATVTEEEVDSVQRVTVETLKEVASATLSTTLDLRHFFCTDGICRTNVGNSWMFRDGIHITAGTSEALAPAFEEILRRVSLQA